MGNVGILALQGCIDPHCDILKSLNSACRAVKTPADLASVERLIIPGGESSTMLSLIQSSGLEEPLRQFGREKPVWGICAGAIIVAKRVTHPEQRSFGFIDIHAIRNFYGSQLQSFSSLVNIAVLQRSITVDFIRAPRLEPLTPAVEVLARHDDSAVLMKQGRILVSAFHVELQGDSSLYKYFMEL